MADFKVEFDKDVESTKETLTKLISELGPIEWKGDKGSFKGSGMASGVKGDVAVAENGDGSVVEFSYSLPFKLKMLGGKIEDQIRKALTKAGGTIV